MFPPWGSTPVWPTDIAVVTSALIKGCFGVLLVKVPPQSGGFQPKSDLTSSSGMPGVCQVPLFVGESHCRDRRGPVWEVVSFPNHPSHGPGAFAKAHLFLQSFSYPWDQLWVPAVSAGINPGTWW